MFQDFARAGLNLHGEHLANGLAKSLEAGLTAIADALRQTSFWFLVLGCVVVAVWSFHTCVTIYLEIRKVHV
jgi:hypothetical protein